MRHARVVDRDQTHLFGVPLDDLPATDVSAAARGSPGTAPRSSAPGWRAGRRPAGRTTAFPVSANRSISRSSSAEVTKGWSPSRKIAHRRLRRRPAVPPAARCSCPARSRELTTTVTGRPARASATRVRLVADDDDGRRSPSSRRAASTTHCTSGRPPSGSSSFCPPMRVARPAASTMAATDAPRAHSRHSWPRRPLTHAPRSTTPRRTPLPQARHDHGVGTPSAPRRRCTSGRAHPRAAPVPLASPTPARPVRRPCSAG